MPAATTAATREAIGRDLLAGATDLAASRAHGVSTFLARTIRRELGLAPLPRGGHNPRRQNPRHEALLENYRAGMVDKANAEAVGCTLLTVKYWRKRQGLPPNGKAWGDANARKSANVDYAQAARLYRARMSDPEICRAIGCAESTIWKWRQRTNRPAVGVGGTVAREVVNLSYRDPLWRACRAAVGNRLPPDLADDAVSEMVVDVLTNNLSREDVARSAGKYCGKVMRQLANHYSFVSLDEDRDGEGWTRLASTPDPGAEASFRMIELSHLAELAGIDAGDLYA